VRRVRGVEYGHEELSDRMFIIEKVMDERTLNVIYSHSFYNYYRAK
jgi:hypothetical protein